MNQYPKPPSTIPAPGQAWPEPIGELTTLEDTVTAQGEDITDQAAILAIHTAAIAALGNVQQIIHTLNIKSMMGGI